MKAIFIACFCLICCFALNGQNLVLQGTAESGEKVLLNADKTWEFKAVPVNSLRPICPNSDLLIRKDGFSISYNPNLKIPSWAAYYLTKEHSLTDLVEREKVFYSEKVPKTATDRDYKKSGFERGHLVPARDMAYSTQTMTDCFYYWNICPQDPIFNRGIWNSLEERVSDWAVQNDSVFVITGTFIDNHPHTIGNNVEVPDFLYKVILDYTNPKIKCIGFFLPNMPTNAPLEKYAMSVDSLEGILVMDFFQEIPDYIENEIEKQIDFSDWKLSSSSKVMDRLSISVQCKGFTKKGDRCRRMTYSPSGYCYQHESQSSSVGEDINKKSDSTPGIPEKKSGSTGEREILTGPRGGKYYINSSGKKVYVRKK